MAEVRIAILGAGAMGGAHAAVYGTMADVSVVGVFSRDPVRAAAVAAICNSQPITDLAGLISRDDLDAIDVCLPSAIHHGVAVAALAAGKHVFCESPMALTLDEARSMRDTARRTGRLLQVGLLMRSVSAYRHVDAAVRTGEHSRLLSITTWRLSSYLRADAPGRKAHHGDPSTELMTFDFDFIGWVMGRPQTLSASAVRTQQGGPGEISALLTWPDGRHATVMASGLMPPGSPFTVGFRAVFEDAAFEHQSIFDSGPRPRTSFTVTLGTAPTGPVSVAERNPFEVELRHFVDCVHRRADPAFLDADRAIDALLLSAATRRSLEECRPIAPFTSA